MSITETLSREGWGPGPWDGEPDRMEFRDEATGLPCLIVRNQFGALCGYVGVAPGHPLYGAEWSTACEAVEVHGGITYAAECSGKICHLPEPGEPDHVYWLGFDCAHAFDVCPGMEYLRKQIPQFRLAGETYKTVAFVRNECADLARQLAAMK